MTNGTGEYDAVNENESLGGAAPAISAHSKDGSAAGQTPASSTTDSQGNPGRTAATAGALSNKARRVARRVKASVRDVAGNAGETSSGQGGRTGDQAAEFVRQQPLAALAATGAICFVLGALVGRG